MHMTIVSPLVLALCSDLAHHLRSILHMANRGGFQQSKSDQVASLLKTAQWLPFHWKWHPNILSWPAMASLGHAWPGSWFSLLLCLLWRFSPYALLQSQGCPKFHEPPWGLSGYSCSESSPPFNAWLTYDLTREFSPDHAKMTFLHHYHPIPCFISLYSTHHCLALDYILMYFNIFVYCLFSSATNMFYEDGFRWMLCLQHQDQCWDIKDSQ